MASVHTSESLSSNVRSSTRLSVFRKVFSFPVLLGTLLAVGVFVGSQVFFVEGDTWLHLAVGQEILDAHGWPTTDSHSFTAQGREAIPAEWLCELIMLAAMRLGGLRGLMVLLVVLGTVLVLLLYYYAYLRSSNWKAAFVASILMLPFVLPFLRLRPQLLGYTLLLVTLICLERLRQGHHRGLWTLPAIFLIWVNIHGTFVFGLFVLGLYWVSGLLEFSVGGIRAERWTRPQRRQLLVVLIFSPLALAVTPYGTHVVRFTVYTILHSPLGMSHIGEYQPLGAFGELLKPFLLLVLAFVVAALVLRPAYRLEDMALLLLSIYLASVHARLLLLFALVFAPFLASVLARWVPNYAASKDLYALNALLMLLLGAVVVKYFPSTQELRLKVAEDFPERAVDYLRQHPIPSRMLNEYKWGGYLMWEIGPEHRVFVDGRSMLYEDAGVYHDYLRIIELDPETLPLLAKYDIQACLIERKGQLATLLAASPDWGRIYADDLSAIFVRSKNVAR